MLFHAKGNIFTTIIIKINFSKTTLSREKVLTKYSDIRSNDISNICERREVSIESIYR